MESFTKAILYFIILGLKSSEVHDQFTINIDGEIHDFKTTLGSNEILILTSVLAQNKKFLIVDIFSNNQLRDFAPKTERSGSLKHEYAVYKSLRVQNKQHRATSLFRYGAVDGYRALVMSLMGPALEELFIYCGRKFSLKTILLLADQMLDRLQTIHDAGYVHGNLTPDSFVMGVNENCCKVYLINMKYASKFLKIRGQSRKHIPYMEQMEFYGSHTFASINRHLGTVASRRDDLESFMYIMLYFLRGKLPWQIHEDSGRYKDVLEMKLSISLEVLCRGLPAEFVMAMSYCRSMKFAEIPDYIFLRRLFRNLFKVNAYKEDWKFDWMLQYIGNMNSRKRRKLL
ncbi:unnamed protein product [Thelazia callipaeda]|uniref:Protein kinase domain-containing protein n=1 Tax=Thelazia callipaeda TaxID=103827 RepID=A0A0N5CMR4_THECL|nr:unnamed protein product [Thelazia callipaeda]